MMPLAFLYPGVLAGLLALPLVYFLLRVIPPAAKRVILPTTRFLHNLEQKNPPTQQTPWWIVLLRLLLLALLIIGLAHPVLHPAEKLEGSGDIILIVDNGWAASQTWAEQQQQALKIAEQAKRDARPVKLILTAPLAGEDQPQVFPSESPDRVISRLKGLSASPWPGRPDLVAKALDAGRTKTMYWISAGLAETGYESLLQTSGDLKVSVPPRNLYPLLLRAPADSGSLGRLEAPGGFPPQRVQVRVTDIKGLLVDQGSASVAGGQGYVDVPSTLPAAELSSVVQTQIAGRNGAGAIMLKDRAHGNNRIGLVSAETEDSSYNFSDPAYYISRAVEPFAKFSTGPIEKLIESDPGIIVLAEGGALPPRSLELLSDWIKKGGILLRFANSALAQQGDALTPVPIRPSERSLQGQMTWEKPLSITELSAESPFAGLPVPTDIKIRRQILAEPVPDLAAHTWVTLSDKTPLITARYEDKGLLVLVHTTATPDWSDLPLSGFYIEIFRKLANLAARPSKNIAEGPTLAPLLILNGYGQLIQPPPTIKPVGRKAFSTLTPSSLHPPGLYGTREESFALNLGDHLAPLEALAPHVPASRLVSGKGLQEVDLAPYFLSACLALFLLDTLIILLLSGFHLRKFWPAVILLGALLSSSPSLASDAEMASQIHLAYIRTGNPILDQASERGLENISQALRDRTAVEPGKTIGLTLGRDPLFFYPLLYWPISTEQPDLSEAAFAALQSYLDHGGMILLDTRDGLYQPGQIAVSAQIAKMRELLRGVSINPLTPAPDTHVFFKTYYLLNIYPEYSLSGDIWIEDDSLEDNVSSIVLTGRDWARIWASEAGTLPADQREQAIRFGINTVMYALTGNYKADQVHMSAILERLGR
jgi:hypothetical protein